MPLHKLNAYKEWAGYIRGILMEDKKEIEAKRTRSNKQERKYKSTLQAISICESLEIKLGKIIQNDQDD